MKQDRINSVFAKLSFLAGVLCFCLVLYSAYRADRSLGEDCQRMKNADLSERFTDTVSYDDGLYAVIGFGVDLTPDMTEREQILSSWLNSSLAKINGRILSAGCVYTLGIGVLIAYGLYDFFGKKTHQHVFSIVVSLAGVYLLYVLSIVLFHTFSKVPFILPEAASIAFIAVGILSIIGGYCAVGLILRKIRFRKTAAVLMVPLVAALFLFGMVREYGLYNDAKLPSFDYLAEIDSTVFDEGYDGELYYDDEKGVIIWEGKEYAAEWIDNPEHYTGVKRAGALFLETADPFSGNSLSLIHDDEEVQVPLTVSLLYVLKAALWILLPCFLNSYAAKHRQRSG